MSYAPQAFERTLDDMIAAAQETILAAKQGRAPEYGDIDPRYIAWGQRIAGKTYPLATLRSQGFAVNNVVAFPVRRR